MDMYFETDGV